MGSQRFEASADEIEAAANQIEELMEWSTENEWFDTEFIEDIYQRIEGEKRITVNQVKAVERIYTKFL